MTESGSAPADPISTAADEAVTGEVVNLARYRRHVDRLSAALLADAAREGGAAMRSVPSALHHDPVIMAMLARHPDGLGYAIEALRAELTAYVPNPRSSAADLIALIRVYLLHQIDISWWGTTPAYRSSSDVHNASELTDLRPLAKAGKLRFRYRPQAAHLGGRVVRGVRRRVAPHRSPSTAGLRYCRARPEVIALLNQVGAEFEARVGARRPQVWLTSAVRSEGHQQHLRALGYLALRPSSHCTGYGMDLAVEWLGHSGTDTVLKQILGERRDRGQLNVIDEGRSWHLCLSPESMPELRRDYDQLRL